MIVDLTKEIFSAKNLEFSRALISVRSVAARDAKV
jgi:hypothetical protein